MPNLLEGFLRSCRRRGASWFVAATCVLGLMSYASGQDISVGLSTQEGYVGLPIALRITIQDGRGIQLPETPEIDGCEVKLAGQPSQSTQTTIINGRRRTRRSLQITFLITPKRIGEFEVPGIRITANGRDFVTEPLPFVVTKSETGDLLFVEISGGDERVYVGEPLEQVLKIWIKPFEDRENGIKLTEGHMWQMLAEQTSWGGFSNRIQELADKRQRPRGTEVIRTDGEGRKRSYYLYEVTAVTYPTRPGKIDADDVRIIVNYPTRLSRSRDPFDSMFDDSPFGSDFFSSPFGASPFGPQLTVEAVRPIVGEAKVDETTVLAIPQAGRPADYRGAVGRYQIVTQATPLEVKAGDPITLNIGIAGTGPMELIQAPPLTELAELTAGFKVTDQSLAGFVQRDTKMFTTTIRPRSEAVTEIPPIPFSFFDPDTETFETVQSDPIKVVVKPAETLSLDAIVGRAGGNRPNQPRVAREQPVLVNYSGTDGLNRQWAGGAWWPWLVLVLPPVIWLGVCLQRHGAALRGWLPKLRSLQAEAIDSLNRASSPDQLAACVTSFIARRRRAGHESESAAAGQLRLAGLSDLANAYESFLTDCRRAEQRFQVDQQGNDGLTALRATALDLVDRLSKAFDELRRRRVRGTGRRRTSAAVGVLMVATIFSPGSWASASADDGLSASQRLKIWNEANELYEQALTGKVDDGESREAYRRAAAKYQQLVDDGVRNSQLFFNLGNACLQSDALGRAIANYHRAQRLSPWNGAIAKNLRWAQRRVSASPSVSATSSWRSGLRSAATDIRDMLGDRVLWLAVAAGWILTWLILTVRLYRPIPTWRIAAIPLLGIVGGGCLLLLTTSILHRSIGIVVAPSLELRTGDGEQFEIRRTIENAEGQAVEVLATRAGWMEVQTSDGSLGWISSDSIERVETAES